MDDVASLLPLRTPAVARPVVPWHVRMREAFMAYLPLVLMVVLAGVTGWLVRHAPRAPAAPAERAVTHDPDYTMERFSLQRFGADGRLRLQIDGARMRHYPDTDILEIDEVRVRAVGTEGGVTRAQARQAQARGDGSEVRLIGGAEVVREAGPQGDAVTFRSEFLHVFVDEERLATDRPVTLRQGTSEIRSGGLAYDHATGVVQLRPPMRAVFDPPGGAARSARVPP